MNSVLGIQIEVDLTNDSFEDIENLFYGIMKSVGDCGYCICTSYLNEVKIFDANNKNARKQSKDMREIYEQQRAVQKEVMNHG